MEITNQTQAYLQAVKTIKEAILKSRYNAAKHVNFEQWQPYLNRQMPSGEIPNEEIVELSFSDTSKPMGVATYRTAQEYHKP